MAVENTIETEPNFKCGPLVQKNVLGLKMIDIHFKDLQGMFFNTKNDKPFTRMKQEFRYSAGAMTTWLWSKCTTIQ